MSENAKQPEDNLLTIGGNQYKESSLSPEIIASIRHILILQNKNKELSTDFAINQSTIVILEGNLKESLKDVPVVPVEEPVQEEAEVKKG